MLSLTIWLAICLVLSINASLTTSLTISLAISLAISLHELVASAGGGASGSGASGGSKLLPQPLKMLPQKPLCFSSAAAVGSDGAVAVVRGADGTTESGAERGGDIGGDVCAWSMDAVASRSTRVLFFSLFFSLLLLLLFGEKGG